MHSLVLESDEGDTPKATGTKEHFGLEVARGETAIQSFADKPFERGRESVRAKTKSGRERPLNGWGDMRVNRLDVMLVVSSLLLVLMASGHKLLELLLLSPITMTRLAGTQARCQTRFGQSSSNTLSDAEVRLFCLASGTRAFHS